jgi:hypothetical protein
VNQSLFGTLWASFTGEGSASRGDSHPARARTRLEVESLEDRTVLSGGLSTVGLLPPAFRHGAIVFKEGAGQSQSASLRRIARQLQSQLQSQPLQLSGFVVDPANPTQLLAIGTILGQTVNLPVMNLRVTPMGDCNILHLELGPLDLNLLGLRIQLTKVCLDITGTPGTPLGGLLCGPAFPTTLAGQAGLLTSLISGSLNPVLTQLFSSPTRLGLKGTPAGIQPNPPRSCPILRLQLAPVNLSLLGLNVSLTSCTSDPIVLDITAIRNGGLLGNLLCGLAGPRG